MTSPQNHRECILIIDDNSLYLQLFSALLAPRDYVVLQAETGNIGLDLARKHQPDLIILDLKLPDLPGIEVATALKADRKTRDIPIITTTAFMETAFMNGKEREVRAAGSDHLMTKPVNPGEFLPTVEALLQRVQVPATPTPPKP